MISLLISCGKGVESQKRDLPQTSDDPQFGEVGSKVCYNDVATDCLPLNNINPSEFGYVLESELPPNIEPEKYKPPIRAMKLVDLNLNQKISPNFKLNEFVSERKGSIGIFSPSVLFHLESLRGNIQTPLKVNSGYRPPNYNAQLPGAAKWSRHMYGDAVDIVAAGISLETLRDVCLKLGAAFTQLYKAHVHCDWRHEKLPEEFFGKTEIPTISNLRSYRKALIDDLTAAADIEIIGSVRSGETVWLHSHIEFTEDSSEEILKRWRIRSPGGLIYESQQSEIELTLEKGKYHIVHEIGGNVRLEKSLTVP